MAGSKIFPSLDAAVADIADGSTIGFAGFAGVGTPCFLIGALIRQGAKRLICVSNSTNFGLFSVGPDGVTIQSIAPGITVDEVKLATGCKVNVPDNLRVTEA